MHLYDEGHQLIQQVTCSIKIGSIKIDTVLFAFCLFDFLSFFSSGLLVLQASMRFSRKKLTQSASHFPRVHQV